jgi:glycosyltransferase involved in cell wall biosynthesis
MASLVFVVQRPTQFEVPFYRHAAADPDHRFRVLYTDVTPAAAAFDPELGREVAWGIDLLSGYPYEAPPPGPISRWLKRQLNQTHDLVIVNGYTRREYLLAALIARRQRSPTALRLDSALFEPLPRLQKIGRSALFRLLNRLFDVYLGVGSLSYEYLKECGVRSTRQGRFPYSIDAAWFHERVALAAVERHELRERWGLPATAPVVTAVAKLHPRETPWDLLRALALLKQQGRSLHLLLAGDGPQRSAVEEYVANHGLAMSLLGYVPYPELPRVYAAADVFVHAPAEERWGVSIGEALACHLPVVTGSRTGAGRDLISSGENGFVYPAGDIPTLADLLHQALKLPPEQVARRSAERLAAWGYEATWRELLATAARLAAPGGAA